MWRALMLVAAFNLEVELSLALASLLVLLLDALPLAPLSAGFLEPAIRRDGWWWFVIDGCGAAGDGWFDLGMSRW